MSNETIEAFAVLVALVEAAALAWAFARSDLTPIVVLNLIGAIGLLFAIVPNLIAFKTLADEFVLFLAVLLVFELGALATNLFWFAYPRISWLVWTEFSAHALLSVAFLIFVFTFRITRLI